MRREVGTVFRVGLLYAGLALCAFLIARHAAQRNSPVHAGLLCHSPTYEFGTVSPGTKVLAGFQITNSGKAHESLISSQTSCSCSVIKMPEEPIEPGESVEVQMSLKTDGRYGAVTETALIVSANGSKLPLRITGTVLPNWIPGRKVVCAPIGGGPEVSNGAASTVFSLRARTAPAGAELQIQNDLPAWLRVGVKRQRSDLFNVSVKAAPCALTDAHDVTLRFRNADYPPYVFRVEAMGPKAPYAAIPPRVFIPTLDAGVTTERTVTIVSRNREEGELGELSRVWLSTVEKDDPVSFSVTSEQDDKESTVILLTIRNAQAAGVTLRRSLNVAYNTGHEIEVPVACFGRVR